MRQKKFCIGLVFEAVVVVVVGVVVVVVVVLTVDVVLAVDVVAVAGVVVVFEATSTVTFSPRGLKQK